MRIREKTVRLWFDMWLQKKDLGIDKIFTEDVVYTESWGPQYEGLAAVKTWFSEWNTRGSVLTWDIRQYLHKGHQTVVEWFFQDKMNEQHIEAFDGISLIAWTDDHRIKSLKEYGCRLPHDYPYPNQNRVAPPPPEEKPNRC